MDVTVSNTKKVVGHCKRITPVLSRVGDKWSVMVIMALREEPLRFNALKRSIDGISQQMLTRVLKALERDGMISRTTFPTNPPQVQYALTELGLSLSEPVMALGRWVSENIDSIEEARVCYDRTHD